MAKTAYFEALRAAMPEIIRNAIAEKESPQLEAFTSAFRAAGEKQQEEAEQKTKAVFQRLPSSPDIEHARLEFEHARKVEDGFHKDFDGLDYSKR
jgi:hypothetical protein